MEKNLKTKAQHNSKKKKEQMQIIPSETCPTSLVSFSDQTQFNNMAPAENLSKLLIKSILFSCH